MLCLCGLNFVLVAIGEINVNRNFMIDIFVDMERQEISLIMSSYNHI